MKVIYNKIIPFPGYKCINICGILFARKGAIIDDITLQHEAIHTALMKEWLYIGFYILYLLEWIWLLCWNFHKAYRNISFEKEAYYGEKIKDYLEHRLMWLNYR